MMLKFVCCVRDQMDSHSCHVGRANCYQLQLLQNQHLKPTKSIMSPNMMHFHLETTHPTVQGLSIVARAVSTLQSKSNQYRRLRTCHPKAFRTEQWEIHPPVVTTREVRRRFFTRYFLHPNKTYLAFTPPFLYVLDRDIGWQAS